MARNRKKYSRAQIRARVRRPKRRGGSSWFYGAMAVIVIIGVGTIVLVRADNNAVAGPPQPGDPATGAPGDHWHTAFDVNICGEWISPPQTFETAADNPNVRVGIHTHGDGFIHTHPFTRSEGGDNATLGRFLGYGGWGVSEDSIDLGSDSAQWAGLSSDPSKRTWSDGDKCPAGSPDAGKKGTVTHSVNCKVEQGNASDVKLEDNQVIALAFLPKGVEIGVPPNATEAPQADQQSTPTPIDNKGCASVGLSGENTTTSTAPATTDTTTTPSS
jgi:hypothetical protein